MNRSFYNAMIKSIVTLAVIIFFSPQFSSLHAQPTNYCKPYCNNPDGTWTCYCYNSTFSQAYAYFTNVKMTNNATGDVVLDRSTNEADQCYVYVQDKQVVMHPGEVYTLYLRWYNFQYYNNCRVYIDWNMDGDFDESNVWSNPSVNEYFWNTSAYGYSTYFQTNITITVPETVQDGLTRMRLMTNYYYNYGPCCIGYCYNATTSYIQYGYGEAEDYILKFEGGVKDTYPTEGDILFANELYNGETRLRDGVSTYFRKPAIIFSSSQAAGTKVNYKLIGPLPSSQVVYEGLDPANGSSDIEVGNKGMSYTLEAARGKYSFNNNGDFKADRGGTYRVYAHQVGKPTEKNQRFTVSWDNDLSLIAIVSPKTNVAPKFYKYPQGQTVKVTGTVQNTGINDVTQFEIRARIFNASGDVIYDRTITYNAPPSAILRHNDKVDIDFPVTRLMDVGVYSVSMDCNLLNAVDQDDYNDHLNRSDDNPYTVECAYEMQLQANKMLAPKQDEHILVGRPITPRGEFKNVGIGDASDVPAKMVVWKLPVTGQPVYSSDITIQDIQAGMYNTRSAEFDLMTLNETGDYKVCIYITAPDDQIRTDDTICTTFHVDPGLQGTFTVGNLYKGRSNNFPTIDSAMNAVYYQGITGPLVFELTDPSYDMTSNGQTAPAWDFTTRIIGLGYNSTTQKISSITWRAARNLSSTRGGVTINLITTSGQGVLFGQSLVSSNPYAILHQYPNRENYNSQGYINFDGGDQKALRFVLKSKSDVFGSAFYFGPGSHDISVKNCLIENGTPKIANNVWVPLVIYSPSRGGYIFEGDSSGTGTGKQGYSAGVVLKNAILNIENTLLTTKPDTIQNNNNTVEANDISGFGYGVASWGLGPLFLQNQGIYKRFYNHDNMITKNNIHDIYRAGIIVGYEESTTISNNRIYNIGNNTTDAAGILVGGNQRANADGYNCVGLKINGNEISGVNSPTLAQGIRVEQNLITYQNPSGGQILFPDVDENVQIMNNVIWGISPTTAAASKFGIHIYTRRADNANAWTQMTTPYNTTYMTRGDKIVNNTIIISDDNGLSNTGAVAGIGIQQSAHAVLYNNAIALLDNSINASNQVAAGVFYHGTLPKDGGLDADRNAYYLGNSKGSIYRFIQTDASSMVLEPGIRDEFMNLGQWQLWAGVDNNSVVGNFMGDLNYVGTTPQRLRVITSPQTPLGSILNNRGQRLDYVTVDVDGNPRGAAGQRYDIGASEFYGRMFVSDVEMVNVPAPGAYMAGSGTFSDAEYIMTQAPCEVKARLRNNGSLQQSDINVIVKIYRENPDGQTFSTTPELTKTVKTSIPSTENVDVAFGLAKGQPTDFKPKTYSDLRATYTVPARFRTMEQNVTPRYRIDVSVESDQNNSNNIDSKIVRYYLKRSSLGLLVSAENSMTDIYYSGTPTADQVAGRLNADSLLAGLMGIGWYSSIEDQRYDVDVFDRLGWEPRSVNYTMYHTVFWSDGNDKPLSRYQRADLEKFMEAGSVQTDKKNLIIGSQDIVRQHSQGDSYNDNIFVNTYLRSKDIQPENPLGANVSNNGNKVVGVTVGRELTETIKSTAFPGDVAPYCGLMSVWPVGDGLSRVAYNYVNHLQGLESNAMGVATTTLNRNVVNLGVDWRNWSDMTRLLRALLDFIDNNGGMIVPVELSSFDATSAGKSVNLTWRTESELNSARFEIEKAQLTSAGRSEFQSMTSVDAAGKSAEPKNYGPVFDYKVEYGNTYVYRLKIVDLDGKYKYSDEKTVVISNNGLSLGEATPNPAVLDKVTFELTKDANSNLIVSLFDMNGKQLTANVNIGEKEIAVNINNLANGSYTLVVKNGDVVLTRKFNVVK